MKQEQSLKKKVSKLTEVMLQSARHRCGGLFVQPALGRREGGMLGVRRVGGGGGGGE